MDTANQNEAVFQYFREEWQIVSLTYVSTASQSLLFDSDKPACYKVIEKLERIEYSGTEADKAIGYAPYAIRFSGGSYNYGVPVLYKVENEISTDPGFTEYVFTMGTLPRAKSGIRNYTSHAKFLYDWIDIGSSAVIILP